LFPLRLAAILFVGLFVGLLVGSTGACGDNTAAAPDAAPAPDAPAAKLAFVARPSFTLAPNPSTPLTGKLELSTNRPTRVSITITDPERVFTVEPRERATTHVLPVLGFLPATTHSVAVELRDDAGEVLLVPPISVTTAALPADYPVFTTQQIVPAQTEPGVTLTGIASFVMAIDSAGRTVWFSDLGEGMEDVRRLAGGHLLINLSNHVFAIELDVFGNVVQRWHAAHSTAGLPGSTAVAVDSFHHELGMLPGGDLFTLSTERKTYDSYPTSEIDPTPQSAPHDVVGDVVVQFARDGTVIRRYSMLDRLDPYRLGYGSFGTFWAPLYGLSATDWSHGNAVFPDPGDGGFLVSLRHQDALAKLDAGGALQWILGTPDNWGPGFAGLLLTPVGAPFAWQFHQHGPRILANGDILMLDNGNFRVSPPAPKPPTSFSRAVEYAVDPVRKEIRQVWQYDADQTIFAPATGDADVGAVTGNVIICFGGASRIVEVTHTEPAVKVFEMTASRTIYRAQRVASLYPDAP
jgi:arylsulfate sulfotransferase